MEGASHSHSQQGSGRNRGENNMSHESARSESHIRNLFERAALTDRARQSWTLFDLGDQGFATVILGVILPIYYSDVAGGSAVGWSYTIALSFAIIAVLSPVLGALADYLERSRTFLGVFTVMGITSTAAIFFMGEGEIPLLWFAIPLPSWGLPLPVPSELLALSFLVILANIGYSGARLFYNSLLPGITTDETIDRVSAAGFAAGYLGGTVILIVAIVLTVAPSAFGIPDVATASRLALFVAACWWAVFVIPLFIYVPEPERADEDKPTGNPVTSAFGRLYTTFQEIRVFQVAFVFLVAYWFYINGVNAIILLAAAYGTEIGISQDNVMLAFLLVQILGVPFALLFGQLADRIETKNAIYCGLGVYILISFLAVGITEAWHFFAMAFLVGMVQGGTQAISRSLFGSLIPTHKSGEFFSFYTIVTGFASIAAPLLFGIVGDVTGSDRLAIASVSVFFIIGTALLTRVDVEKGRRAAREATVEGERATEDVTPV